MGDIPMQMDWNQPIQGQFGTDTVFPGVPVEGGENSDEYWNALIDGKSSRQAGLMSRDTWDY